MNFWCFHHPFILTHTATKCNLKYTHIYSTKVNSLNNFALLENTNLNMTHNVDRQNARVSLLIVRHKISSPLFLSFSEYNRLKVILTDSDITMLHNSNHEYNQSTVDMNHSHFFQIVQYVLLLSFHNSHTSNLVTGESRTSRSLSTYPIHLVMIYPNLRFDETGRKFDETGMCIVISDSPCATTGHLRRKYW